MFRNNDVLVFRVSVFLVLLIAASTGSMKLAVLYSKLF